MICCYLKSYINGKLKFRKVSLQISSSTNSLIYKIEDDRTIEKIVHPKQRTCILKFKKNNSYHEDIEMTDLQEVIPTVSITREKFH